MCIDAGRKLTRINLSEQTDMMDLLGADLPAASGNVGEFAWCDGPLLAALKAGHWVLLDELNLASQSVLEGLNAMLDHRGEIYVSELGETFRALDGFRVFAAQNPLQEGGGRRGLPKSFLNRFTRVHVDLLQPKDLVHIAGELTECIAYRAGLSSNCLLTTMAVSMALFNRCTEKDASASVVPPRANCQMICPMYGLSSSNDS